MKPKIRECDGFGGRYFTCEDEDAFLGVGDTPVLAYEDYLEDIKDSQEMQAKKFEPRP